MMKHISTILFLFFTSSLFAVQADSLFVKANASYQAEKYQEALELYAEIEKNSVASDALFYNMANSYYKLNKVASAIFYYEKTLLLNPTHKDAKFNLSFAKQMAIDNIEPLPKTIGQKFSENFIQKLGYNTWAWIAVGLSFLFALLFLLYHFSYASGSKRFYFVSSMISALLTLCVIAFAFKNHHFVKTNTYAIVFASQTEVKSAPTNSGEVNFELHEGSKVKILESLDTWKKIKIADGKTGWIAAEDIKELR